MLVDWERGLRGTDGWEDLRIEGTCGFLIVRVAVAAVVVGAPTMPILRYLRMTGVNGAENLRRQGELELIRMAMRAKPYAVTRSGHAR